MTVDNNLNQQNENKKQFSIYLPLDMYQKLVELADEDDRSLVSYVRGVLKKHIQKAMKQKEEN